MNDKTTEAAPPSVRGIAEQDYLRWRHNPVTKWFLAYLRDYRVDLLAGAQDLWLSGSPDWSANEAEMKGRARCLSEMAELPFGSIHTFYQQIDKPNEENDAESAGT
jgi:hypothetical protein